MKKLFAFVIVACVIVGAGLTASNVEAKYQKVEQVLYGGYCCDSWGNIRCSIPFSPVGNGCWCYGQGAGVVCR